MMHTDTCPLCKEEIQANALICKHCHSVLYNTREAKIIARCRTVSQMSQYHHIELPPENPSAHVAFCYSKYQKGTPEFEECMNDAKAEQYLQMIAEQLHRELDITFHDIIWGGGDIDPINPEILKKAVRERFSHPPKGPDF